MWEEEEEEKGRALLHPTNLALAARICETIAAHVSTSEQMVLGRAAVLLKNYEQRPPTQLPRGRPIKWTSDKVTMLRREVDEIIRKRPNTSRFRACEELSKKYGTKAKTLSRVLGRE
jgi:hypothetical protein